MDFHERERTLKWITRKIENELPPENTEKIFEYEYVAASKGSKVATRTIILTYLYKLSNMMGHTPFTTLTKTDIRRLLDSIDSSHYSIHTRNRFRQIIKGFFRFLGMTEYADDIKTMSSNKLYKYSSPEDTLKVDEMRKIIETRDEPVFKALFAVLSETGCRIEEAVTMRTNGVEFFSKGPVGATITISGKTGKRTVPLIRCRCNSPNLACNQLSEIIDYDRPYVFVKHNRLSGNIETMNYNQINWQFNKINNERVIRKHIHPHMFRHTVAARLYNWLTPIQLCDYMGWKRNSPMIAIYGRNCDLQITNALLRGYGMKPINPEKLCLWCD